MARVLTPDEAATLKRLGKVICATRQSLKLSQEALADAAKVNRTHMGEVERGSRNVSFVTVTRIAASLGLTPSEMLARADL